jgi:ATP-dependent Clp protease protease subunit
MSDGELSFNRFSGLVLRHGIDLVKREVVISGAISMRTLSKLDKHLKLLEIQEGAITVVINTPGGDVEAALGIVDRIRNSSNEINTIGTGIIMSAGIPILAAGRSRKATKYAKFMYHGPNFAMGRERIPNVDNEVKYVKDLDRSVNSFLAEATEKPYTFWSGMGKHVDNYFGADMALEYGLIHEIL